METTLASFESQLHCFFKMPTLYVNVINATDLKETQLVGRQDPFVEIRSDCQKRYTQYHNNGGRNPCIY